MSDNNIAQFPTSANQGPPMPDNSVPAPTPQQLQQMEEDGSQQVLELIQKNRKIGHENLQRASDALESVFDDIRRYSDGALMTASTDKGKVFFSLEDTLRTVKRGIDGALTSIEALNSILDMLIHDLGGMVHNMNQTQRSMLVANSHLQTLLEVLKKNGVLSEDEMRETWERLVAEKRQEAMQMATQPPVETTPDSGQS